PHPVDGPGRRPAPETRELLAAGGYDAPAHGCCPGGSCAAGFVTTVVIACPLATPCGSLPAGVCFVVVIPAPVGAIRSSSVSIWKRPFFSSRCSTGNLLRWLGRGSSNGPPAHAAGQTTTHRVDRGVVAGGSLVVAGRGVTRGVLARDAVGLPV